MPVNLLDFVSPVGANVPTAKEMNMSGYSKEFARVYDRRWKQFADQAAPLIREYYESLHSHRTPKTLLDLCCGTGQLATHFLHHGYQVTGLDLSPHMLAIAREHNNEAIAVGRAEFVEGDATNFSFNRRFGLVVATFDALNHLPDMAALQACFACVRAVLAPAGCFIFDLNTRGGLRRWNNVHVDESDPDFFIVNRGIFDQEAGRAIVRISGFMRHENGYYERFEETAYNIAFDLMAVREAMQAAGLPTIHFASLQDLAYPVKNPEAESRIFFIAQIR
jgi:SAM-dependent methyltransferase